MRSGRSYVSSYLRFWSGIFLALGIFASQGPSAKAVDEIWFSTSSTVPGSPGDITANYNSLGSQNLYVWLTSNPSDEITPPIPGYTDVVINGMVNHVPNSAAAIAVNYGVTAGSNISLTGAMDINPVLIGSSPTNTRWDAVSNFITGNFQVTPTQITQVTAVTTSVELTSGGDVNSQPGIHLGLSSANDGTDGNPTDPDYVSGDWLLGTVTFDTTGIGSSTLAIQPSSFLIIQGDTDLTNAYTYDSATINVVPEPASCILIGLGGLLLGTALRRHFCC
jgi:hypothetical protein